MSPTYRPVRIIIFVSLREGKRVLAVFSMNMVRLTQMEKTASCSSSGLDQSAGIPRGGVAGVCFDSTASRTERGIMDVQPSREASCIIYTKRSFWIRFERRRKGRVGAADAADAADGGGVVPVTCWDVLIVVLSDEV